jgi:hypothetical protein
MKFKVGGTKKLLPKFIGPFKIIQLVRATVVPKQSATAVKLDLPPNCRLHPVFHVSLLKPYVAKDGKIPCIPVLSVDADGVPEFEVERILDEKIMTISRQKKRCFLLRWKGYSELDDTWEKEDDILSPTLIKEWRRTHPGPPPKGRAKLAHRAPVTAHRPMTRTEARRLKALAADDAAAPAQPILTMADLCRGSRALKLLARQHPTLAAMKLLGIE